MRSHPPKKHHTVKPAWIQGLCRLSYFGLTVLVAAPAIAQSASDSAAVPSAQELLGESPLMSEPAFTPASEPMAEPIAEPMAEPSLETAPPTEPAPMSVDLELSSPAASEESFDPAGAAPIVSPNLIEQAESAFGQPTNSFIDSTPYSLGATDNPSVVLSERSTGCETTIQPGQAAPNSVCNYSLAGSSTGNDSGGYLGAGNDWGSGFSSSGSSLTVVYGGRATPSGSDYYNLTIRPPARLSAGNLSLLFPLSIPAAITSIFGWRLHPVLGEGRFHSGTDLGAPQGTPVLAAFTGKVAVADFMGGYGLAVVLQHQNGTEETLYGHLSEIFVKPGETVKQGETIGRVGSTGLSTGPHLHFEFRKQTPSGWVVMDAGGALEVALSDFVKALRFGLAYPAKMTVIQSASFTKALEMADSKIPQPVAAQD